MNFFKVKFLSPAVSVVLGVVATLILALVVVIPLWRTGGFQAVSDNAALIGALVALGGVFTTQLVSIALEDRRTQEARDLEARRSLEAQMLEENRAGEAALQNYFEAVGDLLIEKPLLRARPGDNLSTVVRAQTLSVLEGLGNPDHQRILVLFLYESGLINQRKLVVRLAAANLDGANLSYATLNYANLSEARLSRANLLRATLNYANLIDADLSRATLIEANLTSGKLRGANLNYADLSKAKGWTEAQLSEAKTLEGATMPDGQILKSDDNPNGPTFEEWLKDRERRGEDGESE